MENFTAETLSNKLIAILSEPNRDLGDNRSPLRALQWWSAYEQGVDFREINDSKDIARLFLDGTTWNPIKGMNALEVIEDYYDNMYGEFGDEEMHQGTIDSICEFYPMKTSGSA